ncbi:MAG TPA: glycosyltransferase family 4 protein [Verrucomicrobiae bacterium]|jgi:glycosyltransferase involved in cell wall biosynthesis|nr:glycosyltransferase family 4 protein [Verrucomicrobiae bacterium]
MRLGLLPALGGGIRELAKSGQVARLVDGYFRRYVEVFEEITYFSYLDESIDEYTQDATIRARVRVVSPASSVSRGDWARRMVKEAGETLRRCDVLRAFQITGITPLRWSAFWGRRLDVPFVTTYGFSYATLSSSGWRRLLKGRVERWALRHAAAVIATTEALRDQVRAVAPRTRVELIPNGVDTARFVPRRGRRPDGGPFRVLYVGRLSAEKNVAAAVEATASLGAGGPGSARVTLTVVGSGPLGDVLRERARSLGAAERVEFRGIVDQRALPHVYAEADAFVLPSFTEGHPKALIEAMACGLPCVVSNRGGNLSLVQDDITGLHFDPERPAELAERLRRVRDDRALAARLGNAARAEAVARYDLGALVDREIALLRDVARTRR